MKQQAAGLMSDEHFTVDGTLIEAWAGQKSFRRKEDEKTGPGPEGNFHGESRSNPRPSIAKRHADPEHH